jgi:hypothetical protein
MRMHKPQIHIVNHDYFAVVTWFGTCIIVRRSKSSNFGRSTFKLKIQLFVFAKNLAKQLVLIAKGILKLNDSKGKTLGGWIITYIRVGVGDVLWRPAHEAKAGEVACLALGLLILLWAGGVIAGEVEVTKGSTRLRYHLLELLIIIIVLEAVLLLALSLVAGVIPIVVVVLVGGWVELLPLGAVDDEVSGVAALEAATRWSPSLLAESVQSVELPHQQDDLVVGDSLVLLIRSCDQRRQGKLQSRWIRSIGEVSNMATNMSTSNKNLTSKRSIMIRMTRPFLDNSWDFNLLNSFSVSRVEKSIDSSKVVIFMPHIESSRA